MPRASACLKNEHTAHCDFTATRVWKRNVGGGGVCRLYSEQKMNEFLILFAECYLKQEGTPSLLGCLLTGWEYNMAVNGGATAPFESVYFLLDSSMLVAVSVAGWHGMETSTFAEAPNALSIDVMPLDMFRIVLQRL